MRKTVKLSEKAIYNLVLREYQEKLIESFIILKSEIDVFYPCDVFLDISQQENNWFFEGIELQLSGTKYKTIISKGWKGCFNIYTRTNYDHLQNHEYENLTKEHTEPNNFKVLSKNNITKWIDYLTAIHDILTEADRANEKKINNFLEKVRKYNPVMFSDQKSGYIEKNGISYKFEVRKGYISQTVELRAYSSTLESFLQLSDNKFVKQ